MAGLSGWMHWRGWVGLALVLGMLTGCGGGEEPVETAEAETGEVYTVRGRVSRLPAPDDPQHEIYIRHEAIPEFVDMQGEAVGMKAMTMPFPVAEAVSLAGIAVGDPVRFTFVVDWEGEMPLQLTRIEELPADTELAFDTPPADVQPMDAAEGHEGHEGMEH